MNNTHSNHLRLAMVAQKQNEARRMAGRAPTLLFLALAFTLSVGIAQKTNGSTFTVNSTADTNDGACNTSPDCTLREAINAANTNPGADTIAFSIGSGLQTIALTSTLPTITGPVVIDGTTQPNFAGSPLIQLNGTGAGATSNGLTISAGNSTVRGLVINRFGGSGIVLQQAGGNVVAGNFVGTNAAGTAALPNLQNGINVNSVPNNTIGGITAGTRNIISGNGPTGTGFGIGISISGLATTTGNIVQGNFIGTDVSGTVAVGNRTFGVLINNVPGNTIGGTSAAARNVISGNQNTGVSIQNSGASGNLVQGNYIGTDVTGTADLGNFGTGVFIATTSNNTIGGTAIGAGNVISGNNGTGISILSFGSPTAGNLVQGNFIGTNAAGTGAVANGAGVEVDNFMGATGANDNRIGGTAAGAGNLIAFNSSQGVRILSGIGNAVLSNSIRSNGALGIDLGTTGVTPNDPCDGDTGANNLQNFPDLFSAVNSGGSTTVQGTLNSTANTQFTIEFFANTACDSSGNGEGQTFLGSRTVMSGGDCNANFTFSDLPAVAAGQFITATATDAAGNTSEFSACSQVMLPPPMPQSVVSRKMHGSDGPFDINLPLTGLAGVECRSGGMTSDYQVVITFASAVTVSGNPQADVTTGTGDIGSGGVPNGGVVSIAGGVVTVPLTNVGNAQTIVITLFGVSDGTNTGDLAIPMSVLVGDTTGNGTVAASDVAQVKSQSGQAVTGANFRSDVNANGGTINASDISLVKSRSGTQLP